MWNSTTTYLVRAGSGILDGDEDQVEEFWYSADNVQEAIQMFLEEATDDKAQCYQVYLSSIGGYYAGGDKLKEVLPS